MKKALTIFVGFIHDFAAGCWGATVLAVYWLHRMEMTETGLKSVFFLDLKKQFFFFGLACVAVVLLAGIGRTFTYAYIGSVYGKDTEKLRKKMLMIKHSLLFIIFGSGIYWQYIMVFK